VALGGPLVISPVPRPDNLAATRVTRTADGDQMNYRANGQIDFFGAELLTRAGGAGGQNRTGYARLFRAALYQ
jgi:hypothetical protein